MTTLPFRVPGVDDLRRVRFNFGGDGGQFSVEFDGYTDDTTWNGWLNVYVKLETYHEQIRPLFVGADPNDLNDDETLQSLDELAVVAERDGTLLSLANCFTTLEVAPTDPATIVVGPDGDGYDAFQAAVERDHYAQLDTEALEAEAKEAEIVSDLILDNDETPGCPVCGGEAFFLGMTGSMSNFRCRDCGWTYS